MTHKITLKEELLKGMHEHYNACTNPLKNERCMTFEDPHDIPCNAPKISEIKKHIKWLDKAIREEAS